jgi:hypothetical protein
MTATRYNVPPSSTLVITVLVPRTSPSSNPCTARSSRQLSWGTERTPNVLRLPRTLVSRHPTPHHHHLPDRGVGRVGAVKCSVLWRSCEAPHNTGRYSRLLVSLAHRGVREAVFTPGLLGIGE